jgi:ascorbate-specific PTS system EIIC-type component UlaA
MASRHRPSEGLKSIVGGALVGLGLHILFGNLDRVAEQMKHMLGTAAWETLGVLPSAVLAASQAVQAYGLDHQGFLQSLLWMLISFWPLLLVIAGRYCCDTSDLPTLFISSNLAGIFQDVASYQAKCAQFWKWNYVRSNLSG